MENGNRIALKREFSIASSCAEECCSAQTVCRARRRIRAFRSGILIRGATRYMCTSGVARDRGRRLGMDSGARSGDFFRLKKFWLAYGGLSGGLIQMRSAISNGHTPEYLATRERAFDLKSRGCFSCGGSPSRKPFMIDHAGAMDLTGALDFCHPARIR